MADEETTEENENTEETAPGEAAAEEAAPEETAAEESADESAPEGDAEASDDSADDAAAPEASGDDDSEDGDGPVDASKLHPKQRRKLERSTFDGEPGPERSEEERIAEREERRKKAAAERRRTRARAREKHEGGEGTPKPERTRQAEPKARQGIVVSSKADKTITVRIESARRHPTYEKIVRRGNKLLAHDEANEAGEGDTVRIVETRPLSRHKRWRLVEIVEKAR